jgi:hypothetical protein
MSSSSLIVRMKQIKRYPPLRLKNHVTDSQTLITVRVFVCSNRQRESGDDPLTPATD